MKTVNPWLVHFFKKFGKIAANITVLLCYAASGKCIYTLQYSVSYLNLMLNAICLISASKIKENYLKNGKIQTVFEKCIFTLSLSAG